MSPSAAKPTLAMKNRTAARGTKRPLGDELNQRIVMNADIPADSLVPS